MNKADIVELLELIRDLCAATTYDGKSATLIKDCNLDSVIWVLDNAISFINNQEDCK